MSEALNKYHCQMPDPIVTKEEATETPVRGGFVRANDGVEIHWRAVGRGPVIACQNGVGVGTFFWKYVVHHFRETHTVLTWDYRGHGRSDRRLDPHSADMSIGRHAEDLATVLQAFLPSGGSALLVGHSMGCQVSLEARRRHPDLVAGLVLILGTAGHALRTFFDNPRSPLVFRAIHRLVFKTGELANEISRPLLGSPLAWAFTKRMSLVDPYYTAKEDMTPYMDHLATLDMRLFIECVVQTEDHNAWDLLPELDRPLLVIAGENDKFTPMWCSRKMVDITPGAELLVLADASHAALIEQPESINHRIERFLRERLPEYQQQ